MRPVTLRRGVEEVSRDRYVIVALLIAAQMTYAVTYAVVMLFAN